MSPGEYVHGLRLECCDGGLNENWAAVFRGHAPSEANMGNLTCLQRERAAYGEMQPACEKLR